jgi:hypothetical protein
MGKHPKKNKRLPPMTPEDKTFVEGVLQSKEYKDSLMKNVDNLIINGTPQPNPKVSVYPLPMYRQTHPDFVPPSEAIAVLVVKDHKGGERIWFLNDSTEFHFSFGVCKITMTNISLGGP